MRWGLEFKLKENRHAYGLYRIQVGATPRVSTYGVVQVILTHPGEESAPSLQEWADQVALLIESSGAAGWIIGGPPNDPEWWGGMTVKPDEYAQLVEYVLGNTQPYRAIFASIPDLSLTHTDPLDYLLDVLDAPPNTSGVAIDVRELGWKFRPLEEALDLIAYLRPHVHVLVHGVDAQGQDPLLGTLMPFYACQSVDSIITRFRVSGCGVFFRSQTLESMPLSTTDLESMVMSQAILRPRGWLAWPLRGNLRVWGDQTGIIIHSDESVAYAAAPGHARRTDAGVVVQHATLPVDGELQSVEITYSGLIQSWVPIAETYLGAGSPIGVAGPDGLHLEVRARYGEREPIDPLPYLGSLLAPSFA